MWINNYDDPPELNIQDAIKLLEMHQYRMMSSIGSYKIYQHPFVLDRLYFCQDDDDVIELTIGEGLTFIEEEEQSLRKKLADLSLTFKRNFYYY